METVILVRNFPEVAEFTLTDVDEEILGRLAQDKDPGGGGIRTLNTRDCPDESAQNNHHCVIMPLYGVANRISQTWKNVDSFKDEDSSTVD